MSKALITDMYDSVKRIEREIQDMKRKLDSIEFKVDNIRRGGRPPPEAIV